MSRARGNLIENLFCDEAEALGYCAFPARGSRGIVDVVCFERLGVDGYEEKGLPSLAVQVGTQGKAITATLDELIHAPRPIGSKCVVARYCKKKNGRRVWKFHTETGKFETLAKALGVVQVPPGTELWTNGHDAFLEPTRGEG